MSTIIIYCGVHDGFYYFNSFNIENGATFADQQEKSLSILDARFMKNQMAEDKEVSTRAIPKDYVEHLLRSIGMFEQVADKAKLNARSMDLFANRELAFDWVHMGNSEIQISQLIDTLHETPFLIPPRTGHIGNWSNMMHGRAGRHDYNRIAFGPHRLGYPLVFDFNQTEAEIPGSGDWVYMPGSVVQRTERKLLELFTWDGACFQKRSRNNPLFTPFTLTSIDGQLLPLARFHRDALNSLGDFRFQSTLFAHHEGLVRKFLHVLLEDARNQDRPEQILKHIFDRCVTLDGRVTRVTLELPGQGLRMGNAYYANIHEIVDHAMLPILLAARPDDFMDRVSELPKQMPFPSNSLILLFHSVLNSHYPETGTVPPGITRPCNPHLHWGGVSMAGYPPQMHGYFRRLTAHLRKLYRSMIRQLPEINPVFNVVLPAGVFNLCPHDTFPGDIDCLTNLMSRVRDDTKSLIGKPHLMSRLIERIVEDWQPTAERTLSAYMIDHFVPRPRIAASLPEPTEGKPVMLSSFTELTIQQASMLMGALSRVRWAEDHAPTTELVG